MSSDSEPYLWEVLSSGLTPNTWRAAKNKNGVIASVHMRKDTSSGKVTCHHVISSLHDGTISFNIRFIYQLFIDIKYTMSLEPVAPPPISIAPQLPTRQVSQAAIDLTVPATVPAQSMFNCILIIL